jgi:hypothetical protein
VIITPLGSEVDPEVYCKKATLFGSMEEIGMRVDARATKVEDLAFEIIESTLTHLEEDE